MTTPVINLWDHPRRAWKRQQQEAQACLLLGRAIQGEKCALVCPEQRVAYNKTLLTDLCERVLGASPQWDGDYLRFPPGGYVKVQGPERSRFSTFPSEVRCWDDDLKPSA